MKQTIALFFTTFIISYAFANTDKVFIVTMDATIDKAIFSYRSSNYEEKFIVFKNLDHTNAMVTQKVPSLSEELFRYSLLDLKQNNRHIHQSFFVPDDSDTLRFEVGPDYVLKIKGGVKYFVEDIIDVYVESPLNSKPFLKKDTGMGLIKATFNDNKKKIEENYAKRLFGIKDRDALLNIATADYYYKTVEWGRKNNELAKVASIIAALNDNKDRIQKIRSGSLTQLFSTYVGYIIRTKQIDAKNTREVIRAIIDLHWKKNITFGYIRYTLPDIKATREVSEQCYRDLEGYLAGDLAPELALLKKTILPSFKNLSQVDLLTLNRQHLTFEQLLANNIKKKYILIDFWASWCKPCREEAPFFETVKNELANKEITLISISIDKDDNVADWKKALKDDGLINAKNQYKLLIPEKSPLFQDFKVPTIPRYILINSKGEIVDKDFTRPSAKSFKTDLARYL